MQRNIKTYAFGIEEQLACLLSKASLTNSEILLAKKLFESPDFNSKNFEQIITFNNIFLLVQEKFPALVPPSDREKLNKIRELNYRRRTKFLELLASFNAQNIPVYLLKGFLLGELVYNNYSYKKMNDIDILIPKKYIHEAIIIFNKHDFYFVGENLLAKKAIDFRLHHSPPLVNLKSNTIIGLHWGLSSPLARRHPTTNIFLGQKTLKLDNLHAHMLSLEHNLLHLCIHLPFFKIGLREFADIANLGLFGSKNINWPFFFETAEKWRALDAVYRVFNLSHALNPMVRFLRAK